MSSVSSSNEALILLLDFNDFITAFTKNGIYVNLISFEFDSFNLFFNSVTFVISISSIIHACTTLSEAFDNLSAIVFRVPLKAILSSLLCTFNLECNFTSFSVILPSSSVPLT